MDLQFQRDDSPLLSWLWWGSRVAGAASGRVHTFNKQKGQREGGRESALETAWLLKPVTHLLHLLSLPQLCQQLGTKYSNT